MEEDSLESTQKKIALPQTVDLGLGVTGVRDERRASLFEEFNNVSSELDPEEKKEKLFRSNTN